MLPLSAFPLDFVMNDVPARWSKVYDDMCICLDKISQRDGQTDMLAKMQNFANIYSKTHKQTLLKNEDTVQNNMVKHAGKC